MKKIYSTPVVSTNSAVDATLTVIHPRGTKENSFTSSSLAGFGL